MIDEVYLLAALRIGAGVDPAPLSVSAAARAAYALRLPGALTAELVPLPRPTGARDGTEPRLHRFAAPGVTIDVELTHTDGRIDVAGQVTFSPDPAPTDPTLVKHIPADPTLVKHAPGDHTLGVHASRVHASGDHTLEDQAHEGLALPPDGPAAVDHTASGEALTRGPVPSAERAPAPDHAAVHEHGHPSPAASPARGRIVIRTPHDRWVRLPTETGYFAATGLPVGWLSIACHLPGRPTVATRWLHTGD
ncbi:hypothetical protein AB0K60_00960 [Thermopolyspora sp. NPDC052614]|uniref:hypothetical protein n=1 Tax=Thermopolyspora sp. NPDC052614 TaxID=3155682 RepID=UPI00341D35F5